MYIIVAHYSRDNIIPLLGISGFHCTMRNKMRSCAQFATYITISVLNTYRDIPTSEKVSCSKKFEDNNGM
jgi:hypothetical protein